MYFLASNGLIYEELKETVKFYDPKHNIVIKDLSDSESDHDKIQPIFAIRVPIYKNAVEFCEEFLSINVNSYPKKYLKDIIEDLNYVQERVETAGMYLIFGKEYSNLEWEFYGQFSGIETLIRDGHIGAKEYEEYINQFYRQNPDLINSFIEKQKLISLNTLISGEILHAEHCLLLTILKLREIAASYKTDVPGEIISYTSDSDAIGWYLADAVKAISTSLDATSKLAHYSSSLDLGVNARMPSVLAEQIKSYVPSDKSLFLFEVIISELFKKVSPLIRLRHELTHNHSLHPIRQVVFSGYSGRCVNNMDLCYAQVMFWDREDGNFARSFGRVGFYKQQKDAVEEIAGLLLDSLELIHAIYKQIILDLEAKCLAAGISIFPRREESFDRLTTPGFEAFGF